MAYGFHYETTPKSFSHSAQRFAIYDSYVICELIVWENTSVVHISCDMVKYSTCTMNKVFASPYSLDESCIFPCRTKIITDCIYSKSDRGDVLFNTALKWTPFCNSESPMKLFCSHTFNHTDVYHVIPINMYLSSTSRLSRQLSLRVIHQVGLVVF